MAEAAIRIALGEPLQLADYENSGESAAVRFVGSRLGTLVAVGGVESAKLIPSVVNVTVTGREGKTYEETRSNTDRLGFVVAKGRSRAEALANCDEEMRCLKFEWKEFINMGSAE